MRPTTFYLKTVSFFLCGVSLIGILSVSFNTLSKTEQGGSKFKLRDDLFKQRMDFIKRFDRTPLNTTPGDARFLRIMVESTGAENGIEVGTATGYGAINMGLGFERTGGKLLTIDISERMVRKARENIKAMHLEDTVTVVKGNALDVLPTLKEEVDFLFLDARKSEYLDYFQAVESLLKPGSVIVADNVIRSADAMKDFLDKMENDPAYEMQIIKCSDMKRDGMAVICKLRRG